VSSTDIQGDVRGFVEEVILLLGQQPLDLASGQSLEWSGSFRRG
jgi:hypothetical protein